MNLVVHGWGMLVPVPVRLFASCASTIFLSHRSRQRQGRDRFDIALVFSTKYEPSHPLLENWQAWQRVKEKFFGYHRDLLPDAIAQRLNGIVVYHDGRNGQWIAVIAMSK